MRVWIRQLPDNHPSGVNLYTAAIGFRMLGVEVLWYSEIGDVRENIAREDIVIDGVQQLNHYFDSMGIRKDVPDYPDILLPFTDRKIRTDTLGNLRKQFSGPIFVKPVEEKLFPGMVIQGIQDWAPLVNVPLRQKVYCSEILDIRSEYRVFVHYDQVMDVRPYAGDYHYLYDPKQLDRMISAFTTWEGRPAACAIDIAVTDKKKTVFLELNDGYAVGAYGLAAVDYARLIATRWTQLMGIPDPYCL